MECRELEQNREINIVNLNKRIVIIHCIRSAVQ